MSTFMAKKETIERKWYVLDAAGKPLGKTAVRAADLLRGKGKVTFTPHADCGDNVIIINAAKAELTGKINLEAERRCCADNAIVNYANATFYPKMVADITTAATTTAQMVYNPLPSCGCGCRK